MQLHISQNHLNTQITTYSISLNDLENCEWHTQRNKNKRAPTRAMLEWSCKRIEMNWPEESESTGWSVHVKSKTLLRFWEKGGLSSDYVPVSILWLSLSFIIYILSSDDLCRCWKIPNNIFNFSRDEFSSLTGYYRRDKRSIFCHSLSHQVDGRSFFSRWNFKNVSDARFLIASSILLNA